MSYEQAPLTPEAEEIHYPHADLLQWEDGQAALAFNRKGDIIEWGSHEYVQPESGYVGSILVTTKSGNMYLLGGNQVIDANQSEESGVLVGEAVSSLAAPLPDVTIGKTWHIPGFRTTTPVTGVLVKYQRGEPNPSATQLSGENLFNIANGRMKSVAESQWQQPAQPDSYPQPERDPVQELEKQFAIDPFAALRIESDRLFELYQDQRISELEKSRQLDNYFRTIETLDRQKYPDKNGLIENGVPDGYIPDGFVDFGGDPDKVARRRDREMIYVDTYATLRQHKAVFETVFKDVDRQKFSGPNAENHFRQIIAGHVASEVYSSMPYGDVDSPQNEGMLMLSTVVRGVCRHHALTSQLLLQAFGIPSRISKNYTSFNRDLERNGEKDRGGRHATNVITLPLNGETQEYMLDTTNPQLDKRGKGMQGLFKMTRQAKDGGWIVDQKDGGRRKYREHDDMFWTVQRQK